MPEITLRQGLIFAGLGAVLWLAVALPLRGFVAAELTAGPWRWFLYALGAPAGLLALGLFRLAGARRGQYFAVISVGTLVALMLDGLAMGWARGLYGTDPARVADAAGTILWGAGVGMLIALWADRRAV